MKGFILNTEVVGRHLQGEEREEKEEKDAMHFYGVREDGKSFIWKETDPYLIAFHAAQTEQIEVVPSATALYRRIKNKFKDYYGQEVDACFFKSQRFLSEVSRMHGQQFLERDINAASRFLMEKQIKGLVYFDGAPASESEREVIYEVPKVRAINIPFIDRSLGELGVPKLRALSIDIETGVGSNQIYSIALYHPDYSKVLMLAGNGGVVEESDFYTCFADEKTLLEAFLKEVREFGPHLFMGWNVMGFDFNFLMRKFEEYKLEFSLGIMGLPVIHYMIAKRREAVIKIPGRAIIEGMDVVKAMGYVFKSYSLDSVAAGILGKKKLINLKGREKVAEIDRQFREDREALARYNLEDAKLVYDLLERISGVEFQLRRVLYSGVLLERLVNQNEILDSFYLPELHKRSLVALNSNRPRHRAISRLQKEQVFSAGVFKDVFLLRFKHLFPAIILAYRLDPLGLVAAGLDTQASLHTPCGFSFHKRLHILPGVVSKLLGDMERSSGLSKRVAEVELRNILLSLQSPTSRHNLTGLYEALIENANYVVGQVAAELMRGGIETIYYDNEVMFVRAADGLILERGKLEERLMGLRARFFPELLKLSGEEIKMELGVGGEFRDIFFYRAVINAYCLRERSRCEYMGVSVGGEKVDRVNWHDISALARVFELMVIDALFVGEKEVEALLKRFRARLFRGDFDGALFFQKRLSKRLEDYEEGSQVAYIVAARKRREIEGERERISSWDREVIEYGITKGGPEPKGHIKHAFDYDYYLEKVIGPSAERVLGFAPYDIFIDIARNKNTQLELF